MRPSWPSSWRFPGGRFGAAFALALGAVGAAIVALIDPTVSVDSISSIGYWRFDASISALLTVAAFALRIRPGLAFLLLALASTSISRDVESISYAARSVGAANADVLLAVSVAQRTVIPAAILTLYATARERRLAPWVSVVGWAITIASIAAPFLRVAREAISRADVWITPWWNELSFQLDQPVPLFTIGALGLLGSLRAAARAYEPTVPSDRAVVTPDRRLLVAAAMAMVFWVPATVAFLNRPDGLGIASDEGGQLFWVPILIVLVAIVSVRWSRVLAWSAIAAAYEAVATLVLIRAVADYLALYAAQPPGTDIGLPVGFVLLMAGSFGIVLFAFAAVSIALLAAWRLGPATAADERRWALRGTFLGLGLGTWYVIGGYLSAGVSIVTGAVFLPAFLMPLAVGIVAWRRLVPAVAEAESAATHPFRPLRYLETVVAEVLTRRAAHERRAAFEERDRVATELDDLRATIGRLLTDRGLTLAPAGGGPPWPAPPPGIRRPSDRELDVVALVARGASNDEIATALVLSLKTVETHLHRLFSRYGVANRTELAVLAVREGWVDVP